MFGKVRDRVLAQPSDAHDSGSFSPRPNRTAAETVPFQALEQLRERVHRRLDQIQDLLRERLASGSTDEREAEWTNRFKEMEEALEAAKSDAHCADRERVAALEKVEQDRALLAEAWERLERERIDLETGRFLVAPAANPPSRTLIPGVISPQLSPIRSASANPADDPVERAVFQQFQALRRDVRRKADSRIVD